MKRSKTVQEYIEDAAGWQAELVTLRKVLQSTKLEETIKWGAPCYMYEGKNVVSIGAFKRYFGLWFFQGALLDDEHQVLVNAQAGKTRAQRQWRMTDVKDIKPRIIKSYINRAIELQRQGIEIKPVRHSRLIIPAVLKQHLNENHKLKKAFEALLPGRRREYANYITEAKRASTKQSRIEKITPMILEGRGLHDRYR